MIKPHQLQGNDAERCLVLAWQARQGRACWDEIPTLACLRVLVFLQAALLGFHPNLQLLKTRSLRLG
jgi:hypothetical protein